IGLNRVGTIKKYFKGVDDVTFYSATREELMEFLSRQK
ncbi:head assembly protein, partial [Cronobacter sakazakii]